MTTYLLILGATLLAAAAAAAAIPSLTAPTSAIHTLLISPTGPTDLAAAAASCLSWKGAYGSAAGHADNIYVAREDCIHEALSSGGLTSGHIGRFDRHDDTTLVWVGEAGVEGLRANDLMSGVWEGMLEVAIEMTWLKSDSMDQKTFGGQSSTPKTTAGLPLLVAQTPSSLVIAVPSSILPRLDMLLPRHLVAVAIPDFAPNPIPVNKHLIDNIVNITNHLEFSSQIDRIVTHGIDYHQLVADVRWLTGENSDIQSRHSFHKDARKAAEWIRAKAQATGAECTLQPFLPGFSPNVVCTYPSSSSSNSTDMVVLSAHYDSRGSFGFVRAPGGDDDGSGTGHLLAIARGIHTQNIRFHKSVVLAWFAGEEQGLLGSAYYAKSLYDQNATVLMHTQADMLGYHDPLEPSQLGFPATIGTPQVAWLLGNISNIYSPELLVGTTAACCSDHQSFLPYGFPATQVFERNGPIIDPKYHNSGDVSMRDGYDFEQIRSIAKVTFAGLLEVAGYEVGERKE